ncbi:hypothetical protein GCM10027442_35590 [Emticicia fontis]
MFAHVLSAQPSYHFNILKDINTQTNDSRIVSIQNAGDISVAFQLDRNYNDDTYKLRLWKYNGVKLENFASSDLFGEYSSFSRIITIDDYVFFYATPNNGTPNNGLYVARLNSPVIKKVASATQVNKVVKLNNKFYYIAGPDYGNAKLFYYNEITNESTEIQGATQNFQYATGLLVVNNQLFFTATVSYPTYSSTDLWVSDGTTAGTHKVKEIPQSGTIYRGPVKLGNRVMYHGYIVNRSSLFISDGTEAGTYEFKNVLGFDNSPSPTVIIDNLYSFGDKVLIVLSTHEETQLWITDGTEANTKFIDSSPGLGLLDNRELATIDGFFYYTNWSGELIKTDGTTRTVVGNGFPSDGRMVYNPQDNCLYYLLSGKLYKTDGVSITMVSNQMMAETLPIPYAISANKIIAWFNPSNNSAYGRELYTVTADSAKIVKDLDSTTKTSRTEFLLNARGKSYFSAYDNTASTYRKFFETDGTTEGTRGAEIGNLGLYYNLVAFRGYLYLVRNNQLQKIDFAQGNYQVIANLTGVATQQKAVQINDKFYFLTADNTNIDGQLWVSDGTTANTKAIRVFNQTDYYLGMAVYNQQLYVFTRSDGSTKIWKYASDTDQPTLVKSIEPNAIKRTYANFRGKLAFIASASGYLELWTTDGTDAGTTRLQYLPFSTLTDLERVYFTDTHYYYSVFDYNNVNVKVYKSDGTPAGKILISNLSNAYSDITDFCQCNNSVFFGLNQTQYSGKSLLYKHNTVSGTTDLVTETEEMVETTKFKNFYCLNQWLYFTTYAGETWETKKKLYTTDGTPAATKSILSLETKQEYSTAFRGGFLFPLNDQELLVRTDDRFYDVEWFTFRKCDESTNLNGATTDSKIQNSATIIESTEKLTGDGRVYYFAPKSITLKAGFTADSQNVFKAEIKNRPCTLRQ